VLRPPDGLLAEFNVIARGLFGRIDHAEAQSRAIATLRDTLLPQLLCGSVGGSSSSASWRHVETGL
jgi:hypothetical protein